MWLMLQQDRADDYVIATGETHSVREFLDVAFRYVGLDYRDYVVVDPRLYRPAEVNALLGDSSKAKARLRWSYSRSFAELVQEMVAADLEQQRNAVHNVMQVA